MPPHTNVYIVAYAYDPSIFVHVPTDDPYRWCQTRLLSKATQWPTAAEAQNWANANTQKHEIPKFVVRQVTLTLTDTVV